MGGFTRSGGMRLMSRVGLAILVAILTGFASSARASLVGFGTGNASPNLEYPKTTGGSYTASTSTFEATNGGCCTDAMVNIVGNTASAGGDNSYANLGLNSNYDTGSIFSTSAQTVAGGFTANFTTVATGEVPAGFTFAVQDDSRGDTAVGANNGALGYGAGGDLSGGVTQITPSFAVAFRTDANAMNNIVYTDAGNNPGTGASSGVDFTSETTPVNVTISYSPIGAYAGDLVANLSQGSTTVSNLILTTGFDPTVTLGAPSGYVGFTTGSNGPSGLQISNFSFSNVPEPASISLLGLGAAGLLARRRSIVRF